MENRVANIILSQLGGRMFVMMTGVNQLIEVGHNDGLGMKLPRNKSKATHLRITLDIGKDLYKMEFLKMRGVGPISTVETFDEVYCDQLCSIFEGVTGMYTRL